MILIRKLKPNIWYSVGEFKTIAPQITEPKAVKLRMAGEKTPVMAVYLPEYKALVEEGVTVYAEDIKGEAEDSMDNIEAVMLLKEEETKPNVTILSRSETASLEKMETIEEEPLCTDFIYLSQNNRLPFQNKHEKNTLFVVNKDDTRTLEENMLHFEGSMVIADPQGELYKKYKNSCRNAGYNVKCLNLYNPSNCDHYNPFRYFADEKDIIAFADAFMDATADFAEEEESRFYLTTEKALLEALIGYIWKYEKKESKTLTNIRILLGQELTCSQNDSETGWFDTIFAPVRKQDGNGLTISKYDLFRLGSGKAHLEVVKRLLRRFTLWELPLARALTHDDSIGLHLLQNKKTVLFVAYSNDSDHMNLIGQLLLAQLFHMMAEQKLGTAGKKKESVKLLLIFHFLENFGIAKSWKELEAGLNNPEVGVIASANDVTTLFKKIKAAELVDHTFPSIFKTTVIQSHYYDPLLDSLIILLSGGVDLEEFQSYMEKKTDENCIICTKRGLLARDKILRIANQRGRG